MYRIFGNRLYKGNDYLKWLDHCAPQVFAEFGHIEGPVHVEITLRLGKGFQVRADLDNLLKPLLDLLKPPCYHKPKDGKEPKLSSAGAGVIDDDSVLNVPSIRMSVLAPHDKKSQCEFWLDVTPWEGTLDAPKVTRKK